MTTLEPLQFSLKTALWTLAVAALGWRLFTSPSNPVIIVPIALAVHGVMLVVVARRPGIQSLARRQVIVMGWVLLSPFLAAALFLIVLHLTGAARPGPIVPWVGIVMFILSLVSLIALPVTLLCLLLIHLNSGEAFAEDPWYCHPFLAACWGTTLVIVRLYVNMM